MLLAFKPLACITFFFLSIFVFFLAPREICVQDQHPPPKQLQQKKSNFNTCHGRRVYIHKLPSRFNSDLLQKCSYGITSWLNFCPHISYHGLGQALQEDAQTLEHESTGTTDIGSRKILEHVTRENLGHATLEILRHGSCKQTPGHVRRETLVHDSTETQRKRQTETLGQEGWHRTDSYMLEIIFHHRLLRYRCLTEDPKMADAFFLPYYTGLDALQYLYNMHNKPKIRHGWKLVSWLQQDAIAREQWQRYGGQDHFIVLGRTPWDFGELGSEWGTGILQLPQYDNMTLLLIERQPWMPNQHAIPYPSSFHPSSSSSLHAWMHRVRTEERFTLFAFAGSIRPHLMKGGIRDILLKQCSSSNYCELLDCRELKCSHNPQPIINAFLHSQFCLQPRGDTPTRRSLFDSLISGCIPVLFHNDTAYTQYTWHLPHDVHTWSVYISEDEIREGALVEDILMAHSEANILEMRETVIALIPKLIYAGFPEEREGNSGMEREPDAFDVSVEEVLKRVAAMKQKLAASNR